MRPLVLLEVDDLEDMERVHDISGNQGSIRELLEKKLDVTVVIRKDAPLKLARPILNTTGAIRLG